MKMLVLSAAVTAAMLYSSPSYAADAAASCASSQLKASSSYAACRLKVDAGVAAKGGAADYSKCDATFTDKYSAAETKAGSGVCTSEGNVAGVQDLLRACADSVTTGATTGAALPLDPITCASDLSSTNAYLAACQSQPVCGDGFITGEETCESGDLNSATCVSEGFAGGTLACATGCTLVTSGCYATRFVDKGDGTITDNQTKLIWEKKSDAGDIHDKDNTYTWSSSASAADGTAYTVFLSGLNGASSGNCFTEKCDWRLPTIDELSGLIDSSEAAPTIFSIFKAGLTPGCPATSASCSWTKSDFYWSSSTDQYDPTLAWGGDFYYGYTAGSSKTNDYYFYYVRAVRAGS